MSDFMEFMGQTTEELEARWHFTSQELDNTPSRKAGMTGAKEYDYRRRSAYLIEEMGRHCKVDTDIRCTAIVYMQRFYMLHQIKIFNLNSVAATAFFLAAKTADKPIKMEHVIMVQHKIVNSKNYSLNFVKSNEYLEEVSDMFFLEGVLLRTLGFQISVQLPHLFISDPNNQKRGVCKELATKAYIIASRSFYQTDLCLRHKARTLACLFIYLAVKCQNLDIPRDESGNFFFVTIDSDLTLDKLEEMARRCPSTVTNPVHTPSASPRSTASSHASSDDQKVPQHYQKFLHSPNSSIDARYKSSPSVHQPMSPPLPQQLKMELDPEIRRAELIAQKKREWMMKKSYVDDSSKKPGQAPVSSNPNYIKVPKNGGSGLAIDSRYLEGNSSQSKRKRYSPISFSPSFSNSELQLPKRTHY